MNCKGCGKELEWYRGRPKEWCAKCLYADSLRRGREYYSKNKKKRLDYNKKYNEENRAEIARKQRIRSKTPEYKERRSEYMKKYYLKRKQLNKSKDSKR
mgnify:CR=1 FL=1